MAQPKIQGEYVFRRQEMVSAFNFTEDGKFQFFYSYGAADRNASGSFTIEGDTLKLKSDKAPGRDFIIEQQSKSGSGYQIICKAPNPHLFSTMEGLVFVGDQKLSFESDKNGVVKIDLPHCDKIYVRNRIFPDIPTLVKDEHNTNNRFEVMIQESALQVSFKGIDFKILDENTITCYPNYLIPLEGIEFHKD
ncbi:MAG: hypothetical protein U0V49_08385 [Saprospiraceae bacterium]